MDEPILPVKQATALSSFKKYWTFYPLCINSVCVCVYHYCMCRDGEWRAISGACPLGLHHKLLTDQERCLMLHRRRVIREGSVIFSHLYSGHTHPQTITHKSSFCHYREAFSSYQRDTRWLPNSTGQIAFTESRSTRQTENAKTCW